MNSLKEYRVNFEKKIYTAKAMRVHVLKYMINMLSL